MREKGNGNKKSHGAEHVELFIMVGENRIELVPQRTSFEGAKRGANDLKEQSEAQMIVSADAGG